MAKILGVILAGGKGRRLGGRNKALIEVGGAPLLDRARAALQAADFLALAGGSTMTEASASGLELLPDAAPNTGPLAGLAAGLAWAEAAGADWLLSTPVDAPFMTPAVFEALLNTASSDLDAVIAEADGRTHWLSAIWRPQLAERAFAACHGTDLSLANFVTSLRHRRLPLQDASTMFLNINTPADLATAEAFVAKKGN
ncbi:MAG: molybdenum cofactor guanylyltransferase [Alphaproteobacteria bacterium]